MVRIPVYTNLDFLVDRKHPRPIFDDQSPYSGIPEWQARQAIEGLEAKRENYRQTLLALSPEELASLLESERAKEQIELEEIEAAQFFNLPDADADFQYWSRTAHWTLDEAVALTFGKDPRKVNWGVLKGRYFRSSFVKRYVELSGLTARALKWERLFDPVLPGIYIAWARQNEIDFPNELERLVAARGNIVGNWKTHYDNLKANYDELAEKWKITNQELAEKWKKTNSDLNEEWQTAYRELKKKLQANETEFSEALTKIDELQMSLDKAKLEPGKNLVLPRERDSMLKLIIGMAVKGYSYDPASLRSKVPNEIVGDLELLGIGLDGDTVRKYLREGFALLPQDPEE